MNEKERRSLVIGVTGHRVLRDEDALLEFLNGTLITWLNTSFGQRRFQVLSALAEGADRLIATLVCDRLSADLFAVLPLAIDEYKRDFETTTSRSQFDALLRAASRTIVAPRLPTPTGYAPRTVQYAWAGGFVARRCDILVALWDGLPARGHGGTAEVVQWFLTQKTPRHLRLSKAPILRRAGVARCLVHVNPNEYSIRFHCDHTMTADDGK